MPHSELLNEALLLAEGDAVMLEEGLALAQMLLEMEALWELEALTVTVLHALATLQALGDCVLEAEGRALPLRRALPDCCCDAVAFCVMQAVAEAVAAPEPEAHAAEAELSGDPVTVPHGEALLAEDSEPVWLSLPEALDEAEGKGDRLDVAVPTGLWEGAGLAEELPEGDGVALTRATDGVSFVLGDGSPLRVEKGHAVERGLKVVHTVGGLLPQLLLETDAEPLSSNEALTEAHRDTEGLPDCDGVAKLVEVPNFGERDALKVTDGVALTELLLVTLGVRAMLAEPMLVAVVSPPLPDAEIDCKGLPVTLAHTVAEEVTDEAALGTAAALALA